MITCVICGDVGTVGHHIDYEKDIKVDVCRSCHPRIHAYGLEELVKKGNYSEVHNLIKKIISKSIMIWIKEYAYEELKKVTDCDVSSAICEIINRNNCLLDENKLLHEKNKKLLEEFYELEEKNKKLRIDK